jgi:hypothetical protein
VIRGQRRFGGMLAFPCHTAVTAGISKGDVGWWDADGVGVHAGKRFRGGGIRGTTSFKDKGEASPRIM